MVTNILSTKHYTDKKKYYCASMCRKKILKILKKQM